MESIGHFRIVSKLGEGGMGQVFRATDTKLGRDVAIKVLPEGVADDPDRMARFTREAQVLASLNHPNIAAIYGVEDRALVMELVEGLTLEERIAHGEIPFADALPIARQIAEALEYAHEKGVIHRDLKPANIKLTADSQAKVLDFGLAKALSNDAAAAANPNSSPTLTMRATMAGAIMGTAAYMSPEQARGIPVDRRADIWSFGVTLYEMLTGSQLFGGPTVSDSLAAVLKSDPDWSKLPGDTPAPIRRLLRRSLERDRKRRLSDIGDARLEIDEALAGSPEVPALIAAPQPARKFPLLTVAASVVALAGIAVAVIHFREKPTAPVAIRFQIPAPQKTNFGVRGLALSPDGRTIAFIANSAEGKPSIWLRPLDSFDAQQVPATEGALYLPFWSPDSRYLGFGVAGRLKKIAVSGGPAQAVAEISDAIVGGTWNRQGVIVFGSNAGSLYRVSQAGGVPAPVTKLDVAAGDIGHLRPWFLPDDDHFLYVTRPRPGTDAAILVGSLNGQPPKRLTASGQAGAYAPPVDGAKLGHVLFLKGGTLLALPLDPRNYDPSGEAFPVADRVGSVLAMGLFSVSQNGVLAYRAGTDETQPIWFDRQGKALSGLPSPGVADSIDLSPDARRAIVSRRESGRQNLWMADLDRAVFSRFTFGDSAELGAQWSHDGNYVYYTSDRGGSHDIYRKNSNGSGNEQLFYKTGLANGRLGNWTRDGRHLVYTGNTDQGKADLWVYSAAEQKAIPFLNSPASELNPQFSPDGRWIAYTSDESGENQVYVQSYPAGAGRFQISIAGGTQPRWRNDAKELFFIGPDTRLMAAAIKTTPKFEAFTPQALFLTRLASQVNVFRYAVAADGKGFLIATSPENTEESRLNVVVNWQAGVKGQ